MDGISEKYFFGNGNKYSSAFFLTCHYIQYYLKKIYRLCKKKIAVIEMKNKTVCSGDIHTYPDNINIYKQLIKIARDK